MQHYQSHLEELVYTVRDRISDFFFLRRRVRSLEEYVEDLQTQLDDLSDRLAALEKGGPYA